MEFNVTKTTVDAPSRKLGAGWQMNQTASMRPVKPTRWTRIKRRFISIFRREREEKCNG